MDHLLYELALARNRQETTIGEMPSWRWIGVVARMAPVEPLGEVRLGARLAVDVMLEFEEMDSY